MRHSAITFADEIAKLRAGGQRWDLIFCSDMLNLAELLGLSPREISELPRIVYFHENQLTYPVRFESERDYQFAMTNITTALAATQVWFNSAYHRDVFLEAINGFLRKMPDHQPTEVVEKIRCKSRVNPPGIAAVARRSEERKPGPIRILWAARAEHDKNPEDFFAALKILKSRAINFRLSMIGERFRQSPEIFDWAEDFFSEHIDRWGYQKSRREYEQALAQADVIVSTAEHEFFGISVVEAIAAGAYPVLPNRLAYPEILKLGEDPRRKQFFYDGSVTELADKLETLAVRIKQGRLWQQESELTAKLVERFEWSKLIPILDTQLSSLLRTCK